MGMFKDIFFILDRSISLFFFEFSAIEDISKKFELSILKKYVNLFILFFYGFLIFFFNFLAGELLIFSFVLILVYYAIYKVFLSFIFNLFLSILPNYLTYEDDLVEKTEYLVVLMSVWLPLVFVTIVGFFLFIASISFMFFDNYKFEKDYDKFFLISRLFVWGLISSLVCLFFLFLGAGETEKFIEYYLL